MAQDVLNLNEDSFEQIKKVLSLHSPKMKEQYDRAVEKIAALSGEWDDDDYQAFLAALNGMKSKFDDLENEAEQLIAKAEYKIEMIRARKNISI